MIEGTREGEVTRGTSVGAGSPECIVLHYMLPLAPAHSASLVFLFAWNKVDQIYIIGPSQSDD